jgi:hypothetical protein
MQGSGLKKLNYFFGTQDIKMLAIAYEHLIASVYIVSPYNEFEKLENIPNFK